jgi:RNA-binding protein
VLSPHPLPERTRYTIRPNAASEVQSSPATHSPQRIPGNEYNGGVKLNDKQRRHLRGLAHPLKPIILVGNAGVTPGVVAETQRALHDHELIKVRMTGAERDVRDAALEALAVATDSALVGRIGHVATLYRPRKALPKIILPA